MAYQKLQGQRAIDIYPEDGVPVPNPANLKASGTNDAVVAGALFNTTGEFVTKGVKAGDVVQNLTTGRSALVTAVVDNTTLSLSVDIFLASPNNYKVFGASLNEGPVLYIGVGGDLGVVTVGGDSVVFVGVPSGSFFPVMVKEITSSGTTATNILALY